MSNGVVSTSHSEDLAFSRALHGNQVKEGFLSNLASKNKRVHDSATGDYLSLWKKPENETEEDEKKRLNQYTQLTNTYYNLATDFYEFGWGSSFHFARYYPGEEFFKAISRHEHYLAFKMNIKSNYRVLDVGCGVGGPAREIAHFTGAHITGLNNNDYQISRAFHYAKREGLADQTDFIKGNFMEMPFEENKYDAVYAIEATVHAPKFEGVYGEIYRVLKPGGAFGCYEWCMTDDYDESNAEHRRIAHGIEIGNGIPKMRKISECLQALRNVGFEIEVHQDLADVGDDIKWYYPLEGDWRKCQSARDYLTTAAMTKIGRFTTTQLVRTLEKLGLAPKGSYDTQKFLETAADALVEGARANLFTPMFFFVARKPDCLSCLLMMSRSSPHLSPDPTGGLTFQSQDKLPKLPIPDLKETCDKYLAALVELQTPKEHEATKLAVKTFLESDGPALQEKLQTYATDKKSYIEEFWYDSYLQYTDSVVLNLNPFFLLEDDPTPQRSDQVVRAASLITSTLKFVSALREKAMEPDVFRGIPLCMSQFSRLFGTSRMPTENGCYIQTEEQARHIVVLAHSQFYHFEVFDEDGNIAVTEKEIVANLKAIRADASKTPVHEIAKNAVGVLTTESRPNWSRLRDELNKGEENREALHVVDSSLFIVCLDHVSPKTSDDLSTNMLCGSYEIDQGVQVGTCTNRWYDKLQIIVCKNGSAGINFEHTGVDGHTVLRFVSDIYTDTILRFAQTINSQTKSIFHSVAQNEERRRSSSASSKSGALPLQDVNPRKIEWKLNKELNLGIRFAETRLSDLIQQNEVNVLEFDEYGKSFIVDMKLSPDAFVQMAFQAAYYDLYGKIECTYEPAMTKTFLHGRTEAIRTVTPEVADFVKKFSERDGDNRVVLDALRKAVSKHSKLTKDCSKGLGHDRHLYALDCLWQRLNKDQGTPTPKIFTDSGWKTMNHTVISTSNCGNPALRLFGFGPAVGNGFGIGYIIKDDGIALCVSSKHRQTARYLDTMKKYLREIKHMLMNEKYPTGTSQRQRLLAMQENASLTNGYGYWDIDSPTERSPTPDMKSMKKVGRRLMLNDVVA